MVAAVFERDGRVLVARRPPGKPMGGNLEFPGGKLHPGEDRLDGLKRELHEELGVRVQGARPLIRYRHAYPDFEVDLDVWCVTAWSDTPRPLEGQELHWLPVKELMSAGLLPADRAVVQALRLPETCLVTPGVGTAGEAGFLDALEDSVAHGAAPLVVLRRGDISAEALLEFAAGAVCRIEGTGARMVIHGDPAIVGPAVAAPPEHLKPRFSGLVAGLHVPERYLHRLSGRPVPRDLLFGVSCHSRESLESALLAGADYAFLGAVKATDSHPGEPGMGWSKFGQLVDGLALPVYAIGGMRPDDLDDARSAGAQGIAAIRSLWRGSA